MTAPRTIPQLGICLPAMDVFCLNHSITFLPVGPSQLATSSFQRGSIYLPRGDYCKIAFGDRRVPPSQSSHGGKPVLPSSMSPSFFGGASAATKVARADELAEKSTARLFVEGAHKAIGTVGKTGLYGAPVVLAYLALTDPKLIFALGGRIAETAWL